MKYISIAAVTLTATLCVGAVQAAEVQSQSEIIKNSLAQGDYSIMRTKYGSSESVMRITDILPDKNQPGEHVIVKLKQSPNHATESTRNAVVTYFRDHVAFPVTYQRNVYEGNQKLQKKIGYTIRRGHHVGTERLVVTGGYIFILDDWKNKDDYSVTYILKANGAPVKQESSGLGGFFKALSQGVSSSVSGESIESLQQTVLQPYLDKATVQQQIYYESWKKQPENAKMEQYLEDLHVAMEKGMRQYNDKIFRSPEYQRMLAHRRWMAKNIDVEVYNNTDNTVWVGSQNSPYYAGIPSGSSSTRTCTGDLYVHFSQDSKSGTKFYNARSACGSKVNIR